MQLTPEQVKGRIKNIARQNNADPRTLMRIYMMGICKACVILYEEVHICGRYQLREYYESNIRIMGQIIMEMRK